MKRELSIEIDTPALVVELPILERNIRCMAKYCKDTGLNLRPHMKSHKCPNIAKMQLQNGALGTVCAKLSEAEAMADAGVGPLLISNQIVGQIKLERLLLLVRRADVTVCVGQFAHVKPLAEAAARKNQKIKVFIEADVGMHRCGIGCTNKITELAAQIVQTPSLQLAGIMGYEGHAVGTKDLCERSRKSEQAHKLLAGFAQAIGKRGIAVPVVSAVGTGTFNLGVSAGELTEIQPGSYCLMDSDYWDYENVKAHFQPAATILATVIDRPTDQIIVLDVGLKGLATDQGLPRPRWRDDLKPLEIHEEHYCLSLDRPGAEPSIGDRLELLPSHICTTVNLYDQFHIIRDASLVDVWPITCRGKMQ